MDTTRGDRCSVNGYDRPTTPALEALASEGINFRNTWSPAGWTGPAHASMFTGLRPDHHGFRNSNRMYLPPQAVTLAELMTGAGYRTACLSSNPTISKEMGLAQGFDTVQPMYSGPPIEYSAAPRINQAALSWLKEVQADGSRFFLFINYMDVHFPYTPPESSREKFRRPSVAPADMDRVSAFDLDVLGEHNLGLLRITEPDLRIMSDLYDAEISGLDEALGELVEELRSRGLLESTLLIITSDHGENLGEHGFVDHMYSLHRTIRYVPLIVRLPGGERAGEICDQVVRLEDLFPTVLGACGLPEPEGIDGKSLLAELGDRRARAILDAPIKVVKWAHELHDGAFDPAPFLRSYRAVFDGHLHWILSSDGSMQVFDTLKDPAEATPLQELPPGNPF